MLLALGQAPLVQISMGDVADCLRALDTLRRYAGQDEPESQPVTIDLPADGEGGATQES